MPGHDIARQAHDAFHGGQRQCIHFLRDAHDQRLADCQSERQANREARSLAGGRFDEQAAAELLDFRCDDIHADAAAGRLRDAAGGAEARLQNELHGLLVGEFRLAVGEPERDGLFADQLHVDAAAVVGDHDHDLRAVAGQAHRYASDLRLAERRASLRRLDAVHDGVAQHVLERRNHALQHLPVEFGGRALNHEFRTLAGVVRGLPHQTRQALHMALERHHARAHQAVLQFGDDARLLRQQILRLASQRLEQSLNARDVARGLGERPGKLLQRRIAVEFERIEVVAARAPRPDAGSTPALRSRFRGRAAAP